MKRRNVLSGAAALAAGSLAVPAYAQNRPIKIAHIYSRTGPLDIYASQQDIGIKLGFEYATNGTWAVNGRRIELSQKDDQGKPDVGKSLLQAAYGDDKVDMAIGPTASNVALAMLPVAEEYKKILLVEPAVADAITGERWNRYIFRTGRNSSQDAIANAIVVDKDNTSIATLAQDYAFGRDGVKALRDNLKKAKIVHEEYVPVTTTDVTAAAQRMIDRLRNAPGRKIISIIWAGNYAIPFKVMDLDPARYGIELATGGNILSQLPLYKRVPGMEGALYYYFQIPKNKVNEWLVANHYKQYKTPPDFFTCGAFSAAIATVEALRKTGGDTSTEKMIKAMEGMAFETPKGRMWFRKEDHQAMQSMYHFKIKVDPAYEWAVPELVREIKPEEMNIPITNKRT